MTDYEALDAQLRAWLDGDQRLAEAALASILADTVDPYRGGEWRIEEGYPNGLREWSIGPYYEHGHWGALRAYDIDVAEYAAQFEPRGALADIAGKRALIDQVAGWTHTYLDEDSWFSCSQAVNPHDLDEVPGSGCADETRAGKPCDCGLDKRRLAVLRCVAAGYVDRPEFKPEWRIDA